MSGIAGQARYEGFGSEIVVWVEFRLSTRKWLSENRALLRNPERETLMAGKDPPSLTLWDFLLLALLYRMFLLRLVYTLHPHQCLLSSPSVPD